MTLFHEDEPTLRRRRSDDDDEVTLTTHRAPGRSGSSASEPPSEPPRWAASHGASAPLHVARPPTGRRSSAPPPAEAPTEAPRAPSKQVVQAWAAWRLSRQAPGPAPEATDTEIDLEGEEPVADLGLRLTPSEMLERYQSWTAPADDQVEVAPKRKTLHTVVAWGSALAALLGLLVALTAPNATAGAARPEAAASLAAHHDLASALAPAVAGLRGVAERRRAHLDRRVGGVGAGAADSGAHGDEAHGTLIVESHGDACTLRIDGRAIGRTDRAIRSLPAGPHQVSCTRNGHDQQRRAFVVAGEISYVGFAHGGARQPSAPRVRDVRF